MNGALWIAVLNVRRMYAPLVARQGICTWGDVVRGVLLLYTEVED